MAYPVYQNTRPSVTSLLKGIVTDGRELFVQEMAAAKLEMQEELSAMKKAATLFGIGIGGGIVSGVLLTLMLVHALSIYAEIPLWACYGIVGSVVAGVSATLFYRGATAAEDIDIVPQPTGGGLVNCDDQTQ